MSITLLLWAIYIAGATVFIAVIVVTVDLIRRRNTVHRLNRTLNAPDPTQEEDHR
jgi:hypothetical protein